MTDKNIPLFEQDENFDKIDEIVGTVEFSWGNTLAGVFDLFVAELVRLGESDTVAASKSSRLIALLSFYFGGRAFYLPVGVKLKNAIRDNLLFSDYQRSDGNISPLAQKYALTEPRVYQIINEQLALHRARMQPPLFK